MSRLNVDVIAGVGETYVTLLNGVTGDASRLQLRPQIIGFSPDLLATNVAIDTNIVFTFNQNIQFTSPSGTIELRKDTVGGSVIESYTTGSSARLTITDNTLTIDPTSDLLNDTTYFITLPSTGIGNTFGVTFNGSSSYQFRTVPIQFSATGGNFVFTRSDPGSPTGFYKYHIFTGTGPLTFSHPSSLAVNLTYLLVAGGGSGGTGYSPSYAAGGGGGAGGVLTGTGPALLLPGPASYTVTIGSGATRMPYTSSPSSTYDGNPSSISGPTISTLTVTGGGNGGGYPFPNPTYNVGRDGGSGGGGGGGGNPSIEPSYPVSGFLNYLGGTGIPGQGNNGGRSSLGYVPTVGRFYVGGGGGGAGGAGSNATYPTTPGPLFPTNPNSPIFNGIAGAGGPGTPVPAFNFTNLAGEFPTLPLSDLSTIIGPTGLYGGGGGGGAPNTPSESFYTAGAGGPGGGGHGAYSNTPPNPTSPTAVSNYTLRSNPSPSQQYNAADGLQHTGGGGGGGTSPNPSAYQNGAGGSGVFMLRYAVASPQ